MKGGIVMFRSFLVHLRQQWMGALALLLVLTGGSAYALTGHNTVFSDDIVNHQVKQQDLYKPQTVRSAGLNSLSALETCSAAPNQWVSFQPTILGRVGYYRDLSGRVFLSGVAKRCGNPAPAEDRIFVLPPGFRPAKGATEGADANANVLKELDVFTDGQVRLNLSSDGDAVRLDGLSFRCGPSGKNGCP
jgi:hypothetical protein